ncbi:MAG: site-specific DNA-methyltransferase, partial [Planctomycetales bacterium]
MNQADVAAIPTLQARSQNQASPVALENWKASGLQALGAPMEEWTTDASNHALRYATHGLFRYFGKFPPTIARRLVLNYSEPGDWVLDPMIGSGTTAVECLLLDRHCAGGDVNPLAVLLSQVKTRRLAARPLRKTLDALVQDVTERADSQSPDPDAWPKSIKTDHYFLPETCHRLHLLRERIEQVSRPAERDFWK